MASSGSTMGGSDGGGAGIDGSGAGAVVVGSGGGGGAGTGAAGIDSSSAAASALAELQQQQQQQQQQQIGTSGSGSGDRIDDGAADIRSGGAAGTASTATGGRTGIDVEDVDEDDGSESSFHSARQEEVEDEVEDGLDETEEDDDDRLDEGGGGLNNTEEEEDEDRLGDMEEEDDRLDEKEDDEDRLGDTEDDDDRLDDTQLARLNNVLQNKNYQQQNREDEKKINPKTMKKALLAIYGRGPLVRALLRKINDGNSRKMYSNAFVKAAVRARRDGKTEVVVNDETLKIDARFRVNKENVDDNTLYYQPQGVVDVDDWLETPPAERYYEIGVENLKQLAKGKNKACRDMRKLGSTLSKSYHMCADPMLKRWEPVRQFALFELDGEDSKAADFARDKTRGKAKKAKHVAATLPQSSSSSAATPGSGSAAALPRLMLGNGNYAVASGNGNGGAMLANNAKIDSVQCFQPGTFAEGSNPTFNFNNNGGVSKSDLEEAVNLAVKKITDRVGDKIDSSRAAQGRELRSELGSVNSKLSDVSDKCESIQNSVKKANPPSSAKRAHSLYSQDSIFRDGANGIGGALGQLFDLEEESDEDSDGVEPGAAKSPKRRKVEETNKPTAQASKKKKKKATPASASKAKSNTTITTSPIRRKVEKKAAPASASNVKSDTTTTTSPKRHKVEEVEETKKPAAKASNEKKAFPASASNAKSDTTTTTEQVPRPLGSAILRPSGSAQTDAQPPAGAGARGTSAGTAHAGAGAGAGQTNVQPPAGAGAGAGGGGRGNSAGTVRARRGAAAARARRGAGTPRGGRRNVQPNAQPPARARARQPRAVPTGPPRRCGRLNGQQLGDEREFYARAYNNIEHDGRGTADNPNPAYYAAIGRNGLRPYPQHYTSSSEEEEEEEVLPLAVAAAADAVREGDRAEVPGAAAATFSSDEEDEE